MKTGFLFLLQTINEFASCVQIPRAIGAFYPVWKWHNVQRATSEMRRCKTHALYRSKLWQQDHCQHPQNANPDGLTLEGTAQRIGRHFRRLRLWSLVWFQVRAPSCHLTSWKSAWKSTPKCTWMCWRVWWSPGVIRWPVADPGYGSRTRCRPTSPKRPRLGFRRSATTLYPSLTVPPPPPTWTHWTTSFGLTSRTTLTWPPTTPKTAWSPPSAEYSHSSRRRLWKRYAHKFRIRIEAVIEAEGGYIEWMSALLHNQVTWIDFFNKSFKIKL